MFCFFNILFVFGRFGRFNRIPALKTCDLTSVKHLCYGVLLRLSFRQPVRPVGTVTKICTLPLTSILCKKRSLVRELFAPVIPPLRTDVGSDLAV